MSILLSKGHDEDYLLCPYQLLQHKRVDREPVEEATCEERIYD
jgi:hypothetical protein